MGALQCRVPLLHDRHPARNRGRFRCRVRPAHRPQPCGVRHLRPSSPPFSASAGTPPSTDDWVAVENGTVVGYASLDESQDFVHAAKDPEVGDALIAHLERHARDRGFPSLAVVAASEDVPL